MGDTMDDGHDGRMRRRRYLIRRLRERARGMARICLVGGVAVLCVAALTLMPYRTVTRARGDTAPDRGCRATMVWPVSAPKVTEAFDPPPQPWNPGHRGVDLAASDGETLLAPADGVIAFAGKVAGKSVVTIRHGALTSTFEPAETDLPVGSGVEQGDRFAYVAGASDHCDGTCVHWGLRNGSDAYLDPQARTGLRKIVLKMVTES